MTEKVDQFVKSQGVNMDWEKLRLEKFTAVVGAGEKKEIYSKTSEKSNQGPYVEKGMTSNNKEL